MTDDWGTTADSYEAEQDAYLRTLGKNAKTAETEAKLAIMRLEECIRDRTIYCVAMFIGLISTAVLAVGFVILCNGQ